MWLFKKKNKKNKVHVDTFMIKEILRDFVKSVPCKMIVYIELTNDGELILHSNKPGILIGYQGKDINQLKEQFTYYGVKKVTVKDMMHVVGNFKLY